jgi:hypothetical protein
LTRDGATNFGDYAMNVITPYELPDGQKSAQILSQWCSFRREEFHWTRAFKAHR